MPPSKVPNVKTFFDPGDLENKLKVTLLTCNKKTCHLCILRVNTKSLPQMVTNLWTFVYHIGHTGKIELLPIKSRNENAGTLF